MKAPTEMAQQAWPEAMATVTACRYDAGALRSMAFGLPPSKRFVISFNYWANGELHEGEYRSAAAVPQGTLFPIRYDAEAPHLHDQDSGQGISGSAVLAIGLVGSLLLLLLWIVATRMRL